MGTTPPPGYARIIPYLYYRDAAAALEFLVRAFGFEERSRMRRGDGSVAHAELCLGDELVMLGAPEGGDARPPLDGPRHGSVLCYVEDVDAHHDRARAAGARVFAPLEDKPYGDRMYGARDPEGQEWYFATRVREPAQGGG